MNKIKNALNKQNNCSVILNHIIKEQVNAHLSIIVLLLNADSGSNNILIQVCTFEEPYTRAIPYTATQISY